MHFCLFLIGRIVSGRSKNTRSSRSFDSRGYALHDGFQRVHTYCQCQPPVATHTFVRSTSPSRWPSDMNNVALKQRLGSRARHTLWGLRWNTTRVSVAKVQPHRKSTARSILMDWMSPRRGWSSMSMRADNKPRLEGTATEEIKHSASEFERSVSNMDRSLSTLERDWATFKIKNGGRMVTL